MGSMSGGMGMSMPLLPGWLAIVWAVAFAGVVVLHLWHAACLPGQRRVWHAGHIAMAAGMAAMYLLPRMAHPEVYRGGLVLYAVLTAGVITVASWFRRREQALNPIWVASAVDYLAMTYMLTPPADRPAWLNFLFAAYLAAEALMWLARGFDRLPVFTRRPVPVTPSRAALGPGAAPAPHAPGSEGKPPLLSAHPGPDPASPTRSDLSVGLSLAVMSAGMAYMLIAM
jgi:hypothetical protein